MTPEEIAAVVAEYKAWRLAPRFAGKNRNVTEECFGDVTSLLMVELFNGMMDFVVPEIAAGVSIHQALTGEAVFLGAWLAARKARA